MTDPQTNPLMALGMMGDPNQEDDGSNPMRKLLTTMMLSKMTGDNSTDSGETGGEVRTRKLDIGTSADKGSAGGLQKIGPAPQGDAMSQIGQPGAIGNDIEPAGFQNGLPTEFPATARKEDAASRLKKAQDTLSTARAGDTTGKEVMRGLIGLIPGIGPAYLHGLAHQRVGQRAEAGMAEHQYEFETQEEERQREAATREKVAMTGLEYTRAAKDLMARIANKKADITQQVGEGRNEVNAAGKGYEVGIGPNGAETVTPRATGDMSEIQRLALDKQQADVEYTKAKTTAVPENVEIARTRAANAQKALELAIDKFSFQQQTTGQRLGMEREGLDYRENGPTMQTKNMAQMSRAVLPRLDEALADTDAAIKELGPAKGRWNHFIQGEIGLKSVDFAKYNDNMEMIAGAMSLVHARGRIPLPIYQNFLQMFDAGKQDPANMKAALQVAKKWLVGYGAEDQQWRKLTISGQGGPATNAAPPAGAPTAPASSRLQRGPTNSSPNTVRKVVRGPNGQLQLTPPPTPQPQAAQ